MKNTLVLTVTPNDIGLGQPQIMHSCPLSYALRRAYPMSVGVEVDVVMIVSFEDNSYIMLNHTPESLNFMENFDSRIEVSPGEYVVNVVENIPRIL